MIRPRNSLSSSIGPRWRSLVQCYLVVLMLNCLASAACAPKVNSILNTMKSKSFTKFCTQMLPIKPSTKTVSSQYTSTVTYSISTSFATISTTQTVTNWVFDIAGTSTLTITATPPSATSERKLKRAAAPSSVSTPPILRTYPPASLTAACKCWSLPTPIQTTTAFLPATTVTRNATTTFTLSKTVQVTTVSSTSRFSATTTQTVTPSSSPSPLGACKPYKIQGTRVFSSAANRTLFKPESFIAYASQNGDDATLSSVAVNSTDSNNSSLPLVFDYSSYATSGDTTVISPDGTNIILHSNGSVSSFAGAGCTKQVRWDPDSQNQTQSQSQRRDLTPDIFERAQASPKVIVAPAYDVSISISDRCFHPVAGDNSWRLFCGVDYIESFAIQPWIEVRPQIDPQNKAIIKATCPSRNITDQSQTPACGKTSEQLRKVCDVYSQAGQSMGPVKYKEAACAGLGGKITQGGNPVAGGITAGVCTAVFVATDLFCAGLKLKLDRFCTPLPTTLGFKVMAYGLFGTVPEVTQSWTQGDPAPAPLALQGTIDVPWESKCRSTQACDCHCNSLKYVYSPWTQVYSGINYPSITLSPYYRQSVELVTNSSTAAGVAECMRVADQPQYADSEYDTVIWYSYTNFQSTGGGAYYGTRCVLPKLNTLGPGDMTYDRNVLYYDSSEWSGSSLEVIFVREKRKVCVALDQCYQVICAA